MSLGWPLMRRTGNGRPRGMITTVSLGDRVTEQNSAYGFLRPRRLPDFGRGVVLLWTRPRNMPRLERQTLDRLESPPLDHRFLGRTEPGEGAGITGAKRGGRMLEHETDERQSLWFQRQAWRQEPGESVL